MEKEKIVPWELWKGRRNPGRDAGGYIETTGKDWLFRLKIWKNEYCADRDTTCPCPMPFGHTMFNGAK